MARGSAQRALLLDLDGTLAASIDVLTRVYHRFLEQRRCKGSAEEFASLNGPSLSEVVRMLKETHGLAGDLDRLLADYRALIHDVYMDVGANAGAHDLLAAARRLNWKTCVVTSNTREIASAWLDRVGIADGVDALVTGELVSRGKPDPEIYLMALARCGTAAEHAVAVEDSPMGATSATRAGIRTYVLTSKAIKDAPWPQGVQPIARLDEMVAVIQQSE